MNPIGKVKRLLGRRPLDWTRGAGRPAASPPASVDVVIPVYGAPDELRACLASVAVRTDLARHGVILVVDGPQPPEVDAQVVAFAERHRDSVTVLRNETRLGFVGSVNRGMRASRTDVVLLNSDTVVTARWLEKLVEAAYSSGDIGTVTPLSNHATLCSVPRAFEENLLPTGFDADGFGELVESVSTRSHARLPTGVGVCLYIRRAVLDEIGDFDADAFGLGYGEENDFCVRALERGWLSVADDATFIFHAGHASFGASRVRLQRRGVAALRRRHPRYMPTVAAFMRADPLAPARARIQEALAPAKGPFARKVVHLVHGWPPFQQAGTELYAWWLVRQQQDRYAVSVYARGADRARADGTAVELNDRGARVRLVTNHFTARNPLRRNAISAPALERDFERFLVDEQPDLLHVHHLAGHAFSLVSIARRMRIPVVMQLQDWWFLCARVNLFDRDGKRCTGPAPAKCARCATLTRVAPAGMNNRTLHALRRRAAKRAIAAADAYVAGSEAIRDDYLRARFVDPAKPFHVLPYGVDLQAPATPRGMTRRPLRFGYVGSISPHKGVHTAVEAMRGLEAGDATLTLWGDHAAFPDYAASLQRLAGDAPVTFAGAFREEEKPAVFSSIDVLLVPSIALESFGLSAREAMTCGVPVIATRGGALSEMFAPETCGTFFPAGDVAELHAILRRLVEDPAIVDRWSKALPVPKRTDVHAAEIDRVYASVLRERRR